MEWFRQLVAFFASASVVFSAVSYYLLMNKMWQVKHELAVAAGVSIASYGMYLVIGTVSLLNMALASAPWQTFAEALLGLANCAFMVAVGSGWWVTGERKKGIWTLIRASLSTERQNLDALAKALANPTGSNLIIDILEKVALLDHVLDKKEREFIQRFANTWGITIDWDKVAAPTGPVTMQYVALRRDVDRYLALSPPLDQALHLADLLERFVKAHGTVSDEESLILKEVGGALRQYGGNEQTTTYEVHLVPQSPQKADAMSIAFPTMERRELSGGPIMVAARCFSREYAEALCDQYVALGHYVAVAPLRPPPSTTQ